MLFPHFYVPETPTEDYDDQRTETESVRASPTPSPTCSFKEPDAQGATV
jgi:hypothetical protein